VSPLRGLPAPFVYGAPTVRLVSLSCSNTEIVCALGRGDWLVGVDDDSDHPAELVASLPRVGRDLQVDAAAVAALRPDLVIASLTVPGHEAVVHDLARQKLPLYVAAPKDLRDTCASFEHLGRLLDAPDRGEQLSRELAEAAVGLRDAELPRPRILVEWWPKPVIPAGNRSWVHDLLLAAGAANAFDDPCESRPLDDEAVAALRPDAVVISWCGVPRERYRTEVVARRPALADSPAVQRGRIYPVSEAFLGRPGPRLIEGARRLRAIADEVRGDPA
jgi:iron complex transport system substrate-binding protein